MKMAFVYYQTLVDVMMVLWARTATQIVQRGFGVQTVPRVVSVVTTVPVTHKMATASAMLVIQVQIVQRHVKERLVYTVCTRVVVKITPPVT